MCPFQLCMDTFSTQCRLNFCYHRVKLDITSMPLKVTNLHDITQPLTMVSTQEAVNVLLSSELTNLHKGRGSECTVCC